MSSRLGLVFIFVKDFFLLKGLTNELRIRPNMGRGDNFLILALVYVDIMH